MKSFRFTFISLAAWALVFASAHSARANPLYFFNIVASASAGASAGNFLDFDPNVSINDKGNIAFVGRKNNGQNIYAWSSSTSSIQTLMNNVFVLPVPTPTSSDFGQTFGPGIQINNQNQVAVRRRMNAKVQIGFPFGQILIAPFTYLETWDATQTTLPQQIAMGDAGIGAAYSLLFFLNPSTGGVYPSPFVPLSSFSAVYNYPSLSNFGNVVFAAQDEKSGHNLLALPISPPYSYATYGVEGGTQSSAPRPVIADDGQSVAYFTQNSTQFVELFNSSLRPAQDIATTITGSAFTALGRSLGVSDDDSVVAYYGFAQGVPGIFANVIEPGGVIRTVRVAGFTGGTTAPGDLGYDASGSGVSLNFDPDSRVCVVHQELGRVGLDDDTFVVCFTATPTGVTQDISQAKGVFTVRVDVKRNLHTGLLAYNVNRPQPVMQVGETFRGRTVTDIAAYDSIAITTADYYGNLRQAAPGDHQIALWVNTDQGQMILRGMYLDSDQDGLPDHWEMPGGGIDVDQDGLVDLDLNALGADPYHKDIFVEIDYMTAADHNHKPSGVALAAVVAAFANAPVKNPDNVDGVNLHVQVDESIPEIKVVNFLVPASVNFTELKKQYFGQPSDRLSAKQLKARYMAFRYCIFGHYHEVIKKAGISEIGGNDFMVTLGDQEVAAQKAVVRASSSPYIAATNFDAEWNDIQATTFMHELGHTLGLRHGGDEDINYKPNYLSIMQYGLALNHFGRSASVVGIPNSSLIRTMRPLDYSRSRLNNLNEDNLDENVGIAGPANRRTVFGFNGQFLIGPGSGPIDWNHDNLYSTGVSSDINYIKDSNDPSPHDLLVGYDDWSNLVYNFRNSVDFSDGLFREGYANTGVAIEDFDIEKLLGVTDVIVNVAEDATSRVKVIRGGFRLNRTTGRFVQTVTLTNTGSSIISGPVSLVLDNLSSNAALFIQTGVTGVTTPSGNPYINVQMGDLVSGASVTVTLEFASSNYSKDITYNTRVLAGTGSR